MKTVFYLITLIMLGGLPLKGQTIMNIHQSNGTILQIPLNTIDSITYNVSNPGNLASINTSSISNKTSNSANSGGMISSDGGSLITQRGICWDVNSNPTTANNITNDGIGTGNFISNLTGLLPNTTYYVRAYAINSAGIAYGNEISFTTLTEGGIVITPGAGVSYNGYFYNSLVYGNGQEWMNENLRTPYYRNGESIETNLSSLAWSTTTSGAYSIYNDLSSNDSIYGKLYNWYAVSDSRHVCPTGWHEPSDNEWTIFVNYLGGALIAGGKMKSIGTIEQSTGLWSSPNLDATNESNFNGLPGGFRFWQNGLYYYIGNNTSWWSSTSDDITGGTTAWNCDLNYSHGYANRDGSYKQNGHYVRCIKD